MKFHKSIRSATAMATILLGLALVAPKAAVAGEYEDALAVVEAVFGHIGDTNSAMPGSADWRIIDVTITAKDFKASGDDARALAMILEAEKIVTSLQ